MDDFNKTLQQVTNDITNKQQSQKCLFGTIFNAHLFGQKVSVVETNANEWSDKELKDYFDVQALIRERGCKSIVQSMGYTVIDKKTRQYGFVHERFECNLHTFVEDKSKTKLRNIKLTLSMKYKMAIQCVEGVKTLHLLGLSHGNISLKCFYLDKNGDILLGDYCLPERYYVGSQQLTKSMKKTQKDVWDLGLVVYQIFTEKLFLKEAELPELPHEFIEKKIKSAPKEERHVLRESLLSNDDISSKLSQISYITELLLKDSWNPIQEYQPTSFEFLNRLADASLVGECKGFWVSDFWVYCLNENGEIPDKTMKMDVFAQKMECATSISKEQILKASKILSDGVEITVERLSVLVDTFGLFYNDADKLQSIIDLATAPWYFDVSKDESQSMMIGKEELSFLIRPSTTDPKYPFTLTKRSNGKTIHSRIEKSDDCFICSTSSKKYKENSITKLVETLQENGVVGQTISVSENY